MNWSALFEYDAESGGVVWKVKRPKREVGSHAGSVRNDGRYRTMHATFNGVKKRYLEHRIVWEIHFGGIPDDMCIDHIDGNGLNNKVENLRLVSRSLNQRNRRMQKTNSVGIQGVYSHKNGFSVHCAGKYVKHTGDFFEACCIRKSHELMHGYHENHGRKSA